MCMYTCLFRGASARARKKRSKEWQAIFRQHTLTHLGVCVCGGGGYEGGVRSEKWPAYVKRTLFLFNRGLPEECTH